MMSALRLSGSRARLWPLAAAAIVYSLLQVSTEPVSAQLPWGKYYSGTGGTISSCPVAVCPTNCRSFEFNSGCGFNSSGACVNCTMYQHHPSPCFFLGPRTPSGNPTPGISRVIPGLSQGLEYEHIVSILCISFCPFG